jgi:Putative MetA-pathway of phenol degradation
MYFEVVCSLALLMVISASAQTNEAAGGSSNDQMSDIAKKLQNPIASLISVPFQNNFDFGGGPNGDGFQYELKFQPVIPITLSTNWNLITRTIVPYVYQHDRIGTGDQSGLEDTTLSLFLSPKNPTSGGLTWGIGPELYFPTATENLLGADKWGSARRWSRFGRRKVGPMGRSSIRSGPTPAIKIVRVSAPPSCSRS